MADVFISYAAENREHARAIAGLLEEEGWSVWWDRKILPGKRFGRVIDAALRDARCVIVLWTGVSIDSDWVNAEASEGRERGILVPVMLEKVRIPLEFRRIQAANLAKWEPGADHAEVRVMIDAIRQILGPSVSAQQSAPVPADDTKPHPPVEASATVPEPVTRHRILIAAAIWAGLALPSCVFSWVVTLEWRNVLGFLTAGLGILVLGWMLRRFSPIPKRRHALYLGLVWSGLWIPFGFLGAWIVEQFRMSSHPNAISLFFAFLALRGAYGCTSGALTGCILARLFSVAATPVVLRVALWWAVAQMVFHTLSLGPSLLVPGGGFLTPVFVLLGAGLAGAIGASVMFRFAADPTSLAAGTRA